MPVWLPIDTFFLTTALVGGSLFVVRLILFLLGAGHDGAIDVPHDFSADLHDLSGLHDAQTNSNSSFRFISLQGLAGFFTMFGLVGLTLTRSQVHYGWALPAALAAGLLTLWIISKIFAAASGMQSDGTLIIANAIGHEGTVYLSIPNEGTGQVQVAVQGAMRMFEAVSASRERIPTGDSIRVIKVVSDKILVVEKIVR